MKEVREDLHSRKVTAKITSSCGFGASRSKATRAPCKAKDKPNEHHIVLLVPAQNANAAAARSV